MTALTFDEPPLESKQRLTFALRKDQVKAVDRYSAISGEPEARLHERVFDWLALNYPAELAAIRAGTAVTPPTHRRGRKIGVETVTKGARIDTDLANLLRHIAAINGVTQSKVYRKAFDAAVRSLRSKAGKAAAAELSENGRGALRRARARQARRARPAHGARQGARAAA